ncbi:MAG: hypothetical protein Q9161_008170 [Pseudevernia consocians]
MERLDGKNPFDPETYIRPAASINTMLELRAFCADFFDKHVRTGANTDKEDIATFLALITHSPNLFIRARAVIPELQEPDSDLLHPNENVQVFLNATRELRGSPGKKWEFLPEEPAWTKLAKDGMDNFAKNMPFDEMGQLEQTSDAGARGSPVNPTVLAPGKAEYKPADFPLHSPVSVASKAKSLPKKLEISNIPTFVPQHAMQSEELVWSPTSGTRPRRPDETYQQSRKAPPANLMQFSQDIPPNVISAYNIKNQYLFHGSRDLSDTPTHSHHHSDSLRMTPPPQFKSTQSPLNPSAAALSSRSKENSIPRRKRRNNLEETPFPDNVDRMMEMATFSHDSNREHSPSSHFDSTAYPVDDLSRTNSPSQFKGPRYPSNQARGVYGAEPFSAPPSVPGYGDLHQTGQSLYGGPPSPFQGQLGPFPPGPDAASCPPFASQVSYAPNPEIWATHSPQPRRGALPHQMPHQITQPFPHMLAQTQTPPVPAQAPNSSETLSVPPPGFMPPLDYWNMLHQRETEIRTRLQHAHRPMTDQEHRYIFLLGEARITAVATQMPARGGMSKGKWLAELGRTLRSIWKTGPGGTGFSPVVVARKVDFEKAIEREMEWTSQETKQGGFVGGLDGRAHGARQV